MNPKIILSLLAICFLFSCSSDEPAGPSFGSIKGRAIDGRTLKPLAFVQITTVPPSVSILTDANGEFNIPELVAGTYVISAKYADSATGQATANVLPGKTAQADVVLSFGPATTGSIIGQVRDESGGLIAGAAITTLPVTSAVTSGANGTYVLSEVAPGDYVVTARSGSLVASVAARVVVGSITNVDIIVRAQDLNKGWIEGLVANQGVPIANALITASGSPQTVTTKADGKFHFSNVTPGSTMVTVVAGSETRTQTLAVNAGVGTLAVFDLANQTNFSTQNLVCYYPLNGNASDLSANAVGGNVVEATFTTDRNGKASSALLTTGSSTAGVIVAHRPALNVLPLTLGAWIRIDDVSKSDCLILGKNMHPNGDGYYLMLENTNLIFVYIANNFSRGYRADLSITANEWVHVAMTIEPSKGTAYINGTAYDMDRFGSSALKVSNIGQFRLGSNEATTTTFKGFQGAIDDVFIYERVMSATEIEAMKSVSL